MEYVIHTCIILLVWLVLFTIIKMALKSESVKKSISLLFLRNILLAAISIWALVMILGQFTVAQKVFRALILSSSLVVAVVGFACQRSLEDLISGIMISMYKPFEVGDRVTLMSKSISGYIESISFRHTILRTFSNSRLIIPNSIINKEILENSDMIETTISNFVDFPIKQNKDVEAAIKIIAEETQKHPLTLNIVSVLGNRYKNLPSKSDGDTKKISINRKHERNKKVAINKTASMNKDAKIGTSSKVTINEINKDYINVRVIVWTKNVDDNFTACSDIRRNVLKRFAEEEIEI